MNYAAVFLAAILGAAGIFWYTSGRKYYSGPLIEAHEAGDVDFQSGGESTEADNKKEVV